jgi:ribosomal-protein-alanine N-acetyltransferase
MHAIRTDRLTLEPQLAAHAGEMFVILSDPAIYAYENQPPRSVEWLRERFGWLESRKSPDGLEHWLNWVVRLPASGLIGYVQATVRANGHAEIAYILSSAHWGRGFGVEAVRAMMGELVKHHGVRRFSAVFKSGNHRSLRLLERLGCAPASEQEHVAAQVEPGERLMWREV